MKLVRSDWLQGGRADCYPSPRRCQVCHQEGRNDTKRKGIGRSAERTHCPQGHSYDERNTYLVLRPDGSIKQRMCRECSRQRVRARRALRKEGEANARG